MVKHQDATDESEGTALNRRTYLKFTGSTAAALGLTGALGGSAAAATIDLGEEGLSEGDTIDGYLDDYFQSGNEVHIPPGRYNWNGGGLDGSYSNAALIGDGDPGDVVFDAGDDSSRYNAIRGTGGEVLVENVTIRGTNSGSPDKLRVDARDENCRVTMRCVWKPDGTEHDGMGFYVGADHVGEVRFEHCWAEEFGDNGLYADGESDALDGRVVVEGGLYRNNNIANVRVGTHDSVVRGATMVHDKHVSMRSSINQRNLRIRQPGENLVIEDCDIYHSIGSYRPVDLSSQLNDQGSGVIRNTRIYTESSNDCIRDHDGGWRAENIHLTGDGNHSIGIPAENVVTGSDAEQASKQPHPPLPNSRDGSTGEFESSAGPDLPDMEPFLVTFITDEDVDQSEYSFAADGPIVPLSESPYQSPSGNEVRATSNFEVTEDDDGVYRAEGYTGSGYGDAYEVYGSVTDVTVDKPEQMIIELNREQVSEEQLIERTRSHTVAFVTSEDAGESPYDFTVEGSITPLQESPYQSPSGDEVRATSNFEVTEQDDGTYRVEGHTGSGYGDAYELYGAVTDVAVHEPEWMTIELDGDQVSESELIAITSGEDDETVDESSDDEAPDGDAPLSNTVVVDGTNNGSVSTYRIEVTGEIEVDDELTTVSDGGMPWDLLTSNVSESTAVGVVGRGKDGYRYSGKIVELEIHGNADAQIDEE